MSTKSTILHEKSEKLLLPSFHRFKVLQFVEQPKKIIFRNFERTRQWNRRSLRANWGGIWYFSYFLMIVNTVFSQFKQSDVSMTEIQFSFNHGHLTQLNEIFANEIEKTRKKRVEFRHWQTYQSIVTSP